VGTIKFVAVRRTSRATAQLESSVAAFETVPPVPVDHQEVVLGLALHGRTRPIAHATGQYISASKVCGGCRASAIVA